MSVITLIATAIVFFMVGWKYAIHCTAKAMKKGEFDDVILKLKRKRGE